MIELIIVVLIAVVAGFAAYCEHEDGSQSDAWDKIAAAVKAEIAAREKRHDMMKEWMK